MCEKRRHSLKKLASKLPKPIQSVSPEPVRNGPPPRSQTDYELKKERKKSTNGRKSASLDRINKVGTSIYFAINVYIYVYI